jgi:hypothetical protein
MHLIFDEEHICTDSFDDGEQYGSWYAYYDFNAPTYAWSVDKAKYSSYAYAGPDIEPGTPVFVVYAVWSSGNSFGNDNRGTYEFMSVTTDMDRAIRNMDALRKTGDAVIENDNGTEMKMTWKPWDGYFESLDELAIATVLFMGPEDK